SGSALRSCSRSARPGEGRSLPVGTRSTRSFATFRPASSTASPTQPTGVLDRTLRASRRRRITLHIVGRDVSTKQRPADVGYVDHPGQATLLPYDWQVPEVAPRHDLGRVTDGRGAGNHCRPSGHQVADPESV